MTRAVAMCLSTNVVQTFGFSFFGAQTSTSGSGASATNSFQPSSGIGTITLDGQGGFALTQWAYTNGATRKITSSGAYAIGSDCSLKLTFAQTTGTTSGGTTGAVSAPSMFRGLLVGGANGALNGVVVEQVDANTIGMGDLITQ